MNTDALNASREQLIRLDALLYLKAYDFENIDPENPNYFNLKSIEGSIDWEYIEIPFTAHGDYVGGIVNRANFEAWMKLYPDSLATKLSFHTNVVIVKRDKLTDAMIADIISLLDYPCLNDDKLSEIESELEAEEIEIVAQEIADQLFDSKDENYLTSGDIKQVMYDLQGNGEIGFAYDSPYYASLDYQSRESIIKALSK